MFDDRSRDPGVHLARTRACLILIRNEYTPSKPLSLSPSLPRLKRIDSPLNVIEHSNEFIVSPDGPDPTWGC